MKPRNEWKYMNIFDFSDYKKFVHFRLSGMPKRGYGQFRKIAQFLNVNSVNISQIFRGVRHLTVEQACDLGQFFGLSELEVQYFVFLVEKERAGTQQLKKLIETRLSETRQRAQNLKERLPQKMELNEEKRAVFYSKWHYSGIRLLSSIPGFQNPDTIANYFQLPRSDVARILEFLLATGLCKEDKGKYSMGPSSTHLEASSPLISRHHTNWRLKAIEHVEHLSTEELCLSMPCSLSQKALREIRKELVECIDRLTKTIDEAPCEQLACLNIDLFKF